MTSIFDRITSLERTMAAAAPARPIPFVILRPVGDPSRASALTEIAELTKTGQKFLTYEIV